MSPPKKFNLSDWKFSDEIWEKIQPHLPLEMAKPKGGRPRMPDRQAMEGIFYILKTKTVWKGLPKEFGAASTVHDRFQEWDRLGVFDTLLRVGVLKFSSENGFE